MRGFGNAAAAAGPMHSTFALLLNRLRGPNLLGNGVIPWAAPVPVFGDTSCARLATVGLNPSGREFVDQAGSELTDDARRFHTLSSLRLLEWSDADARQIRLMLDSCFLYFTRNPYSSWFRPLDRIISGTPFSLYGSGACHLDLVPYATSPTWAKLSPQRRLKLLTFNADILPLILRDSPIHILILNGQSVVQNFQAMTGSTLRQVEMPSWVLPSGNRHRGFSYRGEIDHLTGISLAKPLLVLGYNHNIQSSFGVSADVKKRIGSWIADQVSNYLKTP